MKFNANNLKIVTDNAIFRQKIEEEERLQKEAERKRLHEEAERNRAQRLIDDGIKNAQSLAESGQNSLMVMRLERYGQNPDCTANDRNATFQDLSTAAQMVYKYFENAEFKVEIVWEHDGVGIKDWFNMRISW